MEITFLYKTSWKKSALVANNKPLCNVKPVHFCRKDIMKKLKRIDLRVQLVPT